MFIRSNVKQIGLFLIIIVSIHTNTDLAFVNPLFVNLEVMTNSTGVITFVTQIPDSLVLRANMLLQTRIILGDKLR